MKKLIIAAALTLALLNACTMNNPLLTESPLPYGAPQFDRIKSEHYLPAFEKRIGESKAEIDAIVSCQDAPTFENTIVALEESGAALKELTLIFENLKEADTNDEMEAIAQKVVPMLNDFEMYVSLNESLFQRVRAVYEARETLDLTREQQRLLEKTYKSFVRNGALLSEADKQTFSALMEELSLEQLQFSKNSLGATNAYKLNLTDEADLAGLPDFVREAAASTAAELGGQGWTFDLTYPSMSAFMKYSERRDLREKLYMASATKATDGQFDNTGRCRRIAELRISIAKLLGYETYADYAIEDRMVGSAEGVHTFIEQLLGPSLPAARAEIAEIQKYAHANGFSGDLQPWDVSYWSEKYKNARYALSDEELKPYFQLENCIDAVLELATTLYGITFEERPDIPGYHKDVHVFDVKDADGRHLALFYADFFPRPSKRSGAWMTVFREQRLAGGIEERPLVSIVTNFSKPTGTSPSLLTHDELCTFLHEFGHSLHGILAQGTYASMSGTSVDHDFVELPSQIMENWAYQAEYLKTFAKHYQSGEPIPDELIDKIVAAKNYMAAYSQVRQLRYGIIDMAWHELTSLPSEGTIDFETKVSKRVDVLPGVPQACSSTTFGHIFTGGYAAGYYSYKWAEVLAADAFSLFSEKGIFDAGTAASFRHLLEQGGSVEAAKLYQDFRGHSPEPEALLRQLDIIE